MAFTGIHNYLLGALGELDKGLVAEVRLALAAYAGQHVRHQRYLSPGCCRIQRLVAVPERRKHRVLQLGLAELAE